MQRKVSGTSAVTITTAADNDFFNFSFPAASPYGEEEEDEEEDIEVDFDTITDEETDAELEQHVNTEEHHDVIHPDMVNTRVTRNKKSMN